jgi:hypothetical protein
MLLKLKSKNKKSRVVSKQKQKAANIRQDWLCTLEPLEVGKISNHKLIKLESISRKVSGIGNNNKYWSLYSEGDIEAEIRVAAYFAAMEKSILKQLNLI